MDPHYFEYLDPDPDSHEINADPQPWLVTRYFAVL
jgi:hypothetical protein